MDRHTDDVPMKYDPYASESSGDHETTTDQVYLRHIRTELQAQTAGLRELVEVLKVLARVVAALPGDRGSAWVTLPYEYIFAGPPTTGPASPPPAIDLTKITAADVEAIGRERLREQHPELAREIDKAEADAAAPRLYMAVGEPDEDTDLTESVAADLAYDADREGRN
jgi:hypothetical protein